MNDLPNKIVEDLSNVVIIITDLLDSNKFETSLNYRSHL